MWEKERGNWNHTHFAIRLRCNHCKKEKLEGNEKEKRSRRGNKTSTGGVEGGEGEERGPEFNAVPMTRRKSERTKTSRRQLKAYRVLRKRGIIKSLQGSDC